MLADGVITAEERQHLQDTLQALIGGALSNELGVALPGLAPIFGHFVDC